MAIDMKLLNGFVWEHFKRFVASNPANVDFPETHIEQKDGVVTILHLDSPESQHQYIYALPADQGELYITFKLHEEWDNLVCEYLGEPEEFKIRLLQDFSEHIGQFIAGVPYDIDFTDEELAKIDAARELSGQTREEFIHSAITSACEQEWELQSGHDKCSADFIRKLEGELGDGSTVQLLRRSDNVDVFVAGLKGCEPYVKELIGMVTQHDEDSGSDEIIEFCEGARGKGIPPFELYYCVREQSPFTNEKTHDSWVGMVADAFSRK